MNYEEALDYIHSTLKFGSKLGLENIKRLLRYMNSPDDSLKFIHIAGTNGKGSSAAFISFGLMEKGYRVGTFTSPFIQSFNERIRIGFEPVKESLIADVTSYVKSKVDVIVKEGYNHPTEFEIVTAVAMEIFKREKVEYVVLEVGLGGRLDATNAIVKPICSVITKIGMDHMEYLGDTIEKIAFEKAGIIKPDSKVICMDQQKSVIEVIEKEANNKKSELEVVELEYEILNADINGIEFKYMDKCFKIRLVGLYQVENAILAYRVLKFLDIDDKTAILAISKTSWAGRFEVIGHNPFFIIDAAHNEDGAIQLNRTIEKYFGDRKIIFIFGVMKDKNYIGMIEAIKDKAKMFYCVTPNNKRALNGTILANVLKKYCKNVVISDTILEAVHSSLENASVNDIIIAFGSLYYIGEVRTFLNRLP